MLCEHTLRRILLHFICTCCTSSYLVHWSLGRICIFMERSMALFTLNILSLYRCSGSLFRASFTSESSYTVSSRNKPEKVKIQWQITKMLHGQYMYYKIQLIFIPYSDMLILIMYSQECLGYSGLKTSIICCI